MTTESVTMVNLGKAEGHYYVVHPLDDDREEKCCVDALGPMPMTRSVRWSLLALRGYLLAMVTLVGYDVLKIAGAFGHIAH